MAERTASDDYESMRNGYTTDDLSAEELARLSEAAGPLTDSVRDLIDAVIRSEVDVEELVGVRKEIDQLVDRLRSRQLPGPFGARLSNGRARAWGNPVVGLRNAMAPPLQVIHDPDGHVHADTVLGARFEGPPGMVHGGISALLLDQLVGEAAAAAGAPGMTGTLSLRYRRPTLLGPIRLEAKAERTEGVKTLVKAWSSIEVDGERRTCVEAESVMIMPRWARDQIESTGVFDA